MDEIIDRVARALGEHSPHWGIPAEEDYWRTLARATIEAMREPTQEMARAGGDYSYWTSGPGDIEEYEASVGDYTAARIYEAMIDAALK